MSVYLQLRALARPLKRALPKQLNLYGDDAFLSYVKKKRDGFFAQMGEIKTLALGSSMADYGFKPEPSDRAYNLGLTSADFYTAYHQYKFIHAHSNNLKNIIIFGAVFSPGFCLSKTTERYRSVAYQYFFKAPLENSGGFSNRHVSKIEKICRATLFSEIDIGYLGYERKTFYGVNITAEKRVKTHLRENRRKSEQMSWLQRLLDEADVAGQQVYLIIPPFRSDYKQELEKFATPAELFRKFYELKLGNHKILDYYYCADYRDDCFGDTDHLNEDGARRLTRDIMCRIAGDAF